MWNQIIVPPSSCEVKSLLTSQRTRVQRDCIRNEAQRPAEKCTVGKDNADLTSKTRDGTTLCNIDTYLARGVSFSVGDTFFKRGEPHVWFFSTGNVRVVETARMRPRHVWIHKRRSLHRFEWSVVISTIPQVVVFASRVTPVNLNRRQSCGVQCG